MKLDVTYENDKISFTHIKKRHIKNVYLTIDKKNGIIVKSGLWFKAEDAKRMVIEKGAWIKEKMGSIDNIISTQIPDPEALTFLFLHGRKIAVTMQAEPALRSAEVIEDDRGILIRHHPQKPHLVSRALERFYRRKSEAVIEPLIHKFSQIMQLHPESVSYKKYKRRWGCCDTQNRIVFNFLLAQFPQEVVEYIVIHELAHIKEKNHSKRFWDLVGRYRPDYKSIHSQIKAVH